jgi:hypothetical protein
MYFRDASRNLVGFKGGFVREEDVRLGMLVQVRRGSREADLRDRIGIVKQRFGKDGYAPFEVQFESVEDNPHEMLWASEFEEW